MDSITTETLVLALGDGGFVITTLGYGEHDPFAVRMTFLSAGREIEWTVDRGLLNAGMSSSVYQGDLDFRVRTCTENDCDVSPPVYGAVHVRLGNPDEGFAELHMNPEDVADFLSDTFALVPVGSEMEHVDLDDTIAKLLSS